MYVDTGSLVTDTYLSLVNMIFFLTCLTCLITITF